MKISEAIKIIPQHILPHHLLSAIMHAITRSKITYFKNFAIRTIIKIYDVDMKDAVASDPTDYPSFNHFFTRQLKPNARPICAGEHTIASPVDAKVSQLGEIDENRIFQAKGHSYTVEKLLGDNEMAKMFAGGEFATLYLSPRDYHRIHTPLHGKLKKMIHIPGKLFSVNAVTAENVPELFARNERVVTLFDTDAGPMAAVLVGAIFVSSMETVWAGTITPPAGKKVRKWDYDSETDTSSNLNLELNKGDELGRFNMGSTVILLFPKDKMTWNSTLKAGSSVFMGQEIGTVNKNK
ncbi:MAG: archaetidylserine decarboxylase [Gammaproteobacteria bacterium]|nr:archaetidylserine decarboxylase [Gammaproteobacteria bacterium]